MILFDYIAKTKDGREVKGVVVADSEALAADVLRGRSLYGITLYERPKPGILSMSLDFLKRVPSKALVVFSRQLSVMSAAGVPLVKALRSIGVQTSHKRLKEILREITDDVEGGSRLSDAMAAHGSVFSNFTVNIIRSGETSGRLSEVLNYLADQEEKDYDLRSKIRGAMMYPAFVISGMVVLGFIMMTFVIPKLTAVIQESGAALPLPTRILIAVSGFFQHFWWLIIILAALSVFGVRLALRAERGRYIWDSVKLKLPVFGKLFQLIYIVRFTRSLETLLVGGVDTVSSLGAVAEIVSNSVYRNLVLETKREVEDGNSITTAFSGDSRVPPMLSQMLSVGEETGKLRDILKMLSNFYGREIENMVANMVTLIEPMIMVIMGIGVGVMVSAVILPMYSLASSF